MLLSEEKLKEMEAADAQDAGTATPSGDHAADEGATEATTESTEEQGEAKTEYTYVEEVVEEDNQAEAEGESGDATPKAIELKDDALVLDVDGNEVRWGDIKNQRLMQRDYTQKTQDVSETVKKKVAEEMEKYRALVPPTQEQAPEEDPLADMDPEDPAVKYMRELKAENAEHRKTSEMLLRQNQTIARVLKNREKLENVEKLERMNNKLREQYPVLDDKGLELAGNAFMLARKNGDKTAEYDKFVAAEAKRVEDLRSAAVNEWKDRHKVKLPAERGGTGVKAAPQKAGEARKAFMSGGLADLIAAEDAERARQTNK